jgi:N-acetylglucosaminyldiphosphoundecaprenol N-acetyl-beta-D-mannosaminyltransferase
VLAVKAIAVGVAFDFIAGMVPEAPKWVRGSGFEWVYRLIREPKRLWKRYLIGNIQFLFLAMKDKLQTKR